jgi:hypothetical protein
MNFTDLFIVAVLAITVYGLIVAISRRRQFLTEAVNPHRGAWLLAGLTVFWCGVGLLRLEAKSWELADFARVLSHLVTEQNLSPRGKVAAVALLMGLLFAALVFWCWLTLPRDPRTFRRPADRRRAFRYYVSTLKGGLDYAALVREDGERLEEAWNAKQIRARLDHLPRVADAPGAPRQVRTEDDQLRFWQAAALHLHRSMATLDAAIAPAHHGHNRRLVFDAEYGGLFFIYLRPPDAHGDCLYLFGATLNQEEMNLKTADRDFDLLLHALRHIEDSIKRS